MLTIKIIGEDGVQIVKEVKSIMATPDHDNPNYFKRVSYWEPGVKSFDEYHVSHGKVYVMNDGGKTVADYMMTPSTEPTTVMAKKK
jgi:hypothetical protein